MTGGEFPVLPDVPRSGLGRRLGAYVHVCARCPARHITLGGEFNGQYAADVLAREAGWTKRKPLALWHCPDCAPHARAGGPL